MARCPLLALSGHRLAAALAAQEEENHGTGDRVGKHLLTEGSSTSAGALGDRSALGIFVLLLLVQAHDGRRGADDDRHGETAETPEPVEQRRHGAARRK